MKKIILVLLGLFVTINVKAVNCSKEELDNLVELANNIEIKYTYKIENDSESDYTGVAYFIDILNMNEDLQFRYDKYTPVSESQLKEYTYREGDKLKVSIYSYTKDYCTNDLLRTITIDFPYYNLYYQNNKEKCSNYPDFKYCKEFMNIGNISFSEIDSLFDEYINGNNNKKEDNKNNLLFNGYYYIGMVVLIIILFVYIFYVLRKRKKDDLKK